MTMIKGEPASASDKSINHNLDYEIYRRRSKKGGLMKIKGTCWFVQGKDGYKIYVEGKEDDQCRKSMRNLALNKEFQKEQHVCSAEELYEILIKQYDDQFYTLDDSVGYLMDGLEFLNCVRDKCITNNDGSMEFITVDGYNSNLGLFSNSFVDGKFLVTEDVFEEICKEYEVKVLWINK